MSTADISLFSLPLLMKKVMPRQLCGTCEMQKCSVWLWSIPYSDDGSKKSLSYLLTSSQMGTGELKSELTSSDSAHACEVWEGGGVKMLWNSSYSFLSIYLNHLSTRVGTQQALGDGNIHFPSQKSKYSNKIISFSEKKDRQNNGLCRGKCFNIPHC